MNSFLLLAIGVLIMQVILFLLIRKKKREERKNSIIEKYQIKSASDAFRLIQDPSIPEDDRKKIEALYQGKS